MNGFRALHIGFIALMIVVMTGPLHGTTSCPAANPTDSFPDDGALNTCISQGGTVTLEYGWPGYIIATGLHLATNDVVIQGDGGLTPRFIAHADLAATMLEVADGTSGYTITGVVFDGNKSNRTQGSLCSNDNTVGFNVRTRGSNYTISNIISIYALCGTALGLDGSNYLVTGNQIYWNGTSVLAGGPWSDGITVASCHGGTITNNLLAENTDIDLIVGLGANCTVTDNEIYHRFTYGLAGLMAGFDGDRTGSVIQGNYVYSDLNLLSIGLMAGHHAWDSDSNIDNVGTITENHFEGMVTLAWIEGIGSGNIVGNTGGNRRGTQQLAFTLCTETPEYAAAHYGSATLQGTPTAMNFDDHICY